MGGASIWHWLVVGVLIMVFFGRGKLSEMMGDMAKGIKAFKKGMAEDDTVAATTPAPAAGHPVTTETVRTIEHRNLDTTSTQSPTLADRKIG